MYHYSVDTFFSIYLIRSMSNTLERYQRSSFSPHDNAIKQETEVAIYAIYTSLFLPKFVMISFKLVMHMCFLIFGRAGMKKSQNWELNMSHFCALKGYK